MRPIQSLSTLSHIGPEGDPQMVDITGKVTSVRQATAEGCIQLSKKAMQLVKDPLLNPKGSILAVAQVAAIMAVKKTPDLIPLCHPIPISDVHVKLLIEKEEVRVRVSVKSEGVTGVEMEALTGVTIALLAIYDMTKSVGYEHKITGVHLVNKTGGKSDHTSST